jgi:hypothetical protein
MYVPPHSWEQCASFSWFPVFTYSHTTRVVRLVNLPSHDTRCGSRHPQRLVVWSIVQEFREVKLTHSLVSPLLEEACVKPQFQDASPAVHISALSHSHLSQFFFFKRHKPEDSLEFLDACPKQLSGRPIDHQVFMKRSYRSFFTSCVVGEESVFVT